MAIKETETPAPKKRRTLPAPLLGAGFSLNSVNALIEMQGESRKASTRLRKARARSRQRMLQEALARRR